MTKHRSPRPDTRAREKTLASRLGLFDVRAITRPFTVQAKRQLLFSVHPLERVSDAPEALWQDYVDLDQRAAFRRIAELGCSHVR
jgi:hypothetical protein